MRTHSVLLGLVVAVLASAMGCGGTGSSRSPASGVEEDPCLLVSAAEGVADTIRISFIDPFRPERGPVAESEAERLLDRHLYETLIRVDCRGRPAPGLAESWRSRDGGREWEFRLRSGTRFADGNHLEAEDIREAWTDLLARFPERKRYAPWVWVHPESIRTLGTDRIQIRLAGIRAGDPGLFAAPELAVTRRGEPGSIPLGSGPYTVLRSSGAGVVCVPNPFHPVPGRSPLRFTHHEVADPRDLLGGEADVVVISRRENIEYALRLPEHRSIPLPWNRLYLLLVPGAACRSDPAARSALRTLREELALRIVRSEARPADAFTLDETASGCPEPEGTAVSPRAAATPAPRILTWDRDEDAGRIASRLVALEQSDPSESGAGAAIPCMVSGAELVAEAAPWTGWMPSLIEGGDAGYVLSVRRSLPDPCLEFDTLPVAVPWLEGTSPGSAVLSGPAVIPLVAARDHVVLRSGLVGVGVDWDGTPRLSGALWDREGTVP